MKRMLRIYICMLFSCCSFFAVAGDTIIVKKDHRLDILSAKQVQANKRGALMTSSGTYKGYRIQVLSTASRDNAFDLRTALQVNFPDHKSYVVYQSPNFKVRIGNFLRREDADNFRKQLIKTYPEGLYIVDDVIEYTASEETEEIPQ